MRKKFIPITRFNLHGQIFRVMLNKESGELALLIPKKAIGDIVFILEDLVGDYKVSGLGEFPEEAEDG